MMARSLTKLLCGASVLATLVFGLVGCGPEYDRTEISSVKGQGTLGGAVDTRALDVPEGLVITAHIAVWNDDDEQMSLTVRSRDPSTVEVAGVVNDHNYAFIGRKTGRTEIEFVADGTVVLTIPATVTKQPELP
jgi:hypothetical protein